MFPQHAPSVPETSSLSSLRKMIRCNDDPHIDAPIGRLSTAASTSGRDPIHQVARSIPYPLLESSITPLDDHLQHCWRTQTLHDPPSALVTRDDHHLLKTGLVQRGRRRHRPPMPLVKSLRHDFGKFFSPFFSTSKTRPSLEYGMTPFPGSCRISTGTTGVQPSTSCASALLFVPPPCT